RHADAPSPRRCMGAAARASAERANCVSVAHRRFLPTWRLVMHRSIRTLAVLATAATAAPKKYTVDPKHTFPSFEADHFGGMSVWRGKFEKTTGTMSIDAEAKTGSVEVTIDASSVDTGMADLNDHLKKADFLEVDKYPTATYKGTLAKFKD